MSIVVVTGASGFLGGRLVEKLNEVGFTVRTTGRSEQLERFKDLGVEHIKADIQDPSTLERAFSGAGAVFHLAGLVSYRRTDYDKLFKTNVLGTRNVMKACMDAGVERVIHMGSIAGMGVPKPGEIGTEELEYNLKGHGLYYCDTKYEGSQEVKRFAKQGLPVLELSPGITFGDGDTHPHHHTIFRAMASGWFIGYPAGGVMFSDIEDVVGACLSSLVRGEPGQNYVVGSANLTFKQAGEELAKVLNGRPPFFQIPGWISESAGVTSETLAQLFGTKPKLTWQVAWLSQQKIFFSSDKAIRELGYKQTPFEETLKRTAPYYLRKS